MNDNLVILLGAGASLEAGMPSTADLTANVKNWEGWRYNDNRELIPETNGISESQDLSRKRIAIGKFLKSADILIREYYNENYSPNYEDYYYLAKQIDDALSGNYDNPAIQPLLKHWLKEVLEKLNVSEEECVDFLREVTEYIVYIVCSVIKMSPVDDIRYLEDALLPLTCDKRLCTSIITLNHDTVVEKLLDSRGIRFEDGFVRNDRGIPVFSRSSFNSKDEAIFLLKPHGSIDWHTFEVKDELPRIQHIGKLYGDIEHVPDGKGNYLDVLLRHRNLLIGTHNEMLDYTSYVFRDLYFQSFKRLWDSNKLVICGYGFRDKGINSLLIDWFYSSRERSAVVIHKDEENLVENSRLAIKGKWNKLKDGDKLKVIPKWIEDVTSDEIKAALE